MEIKESVGYLISNTGRKLNHKLQQLFQDYDVTPEQWSLLACLHEHDGITHKDLAIRIEKDPANITRLVDQLERKSLVSRVANPSDRRSQLLYITESGRASVIALAPIEASFVEQLISNLTEEEITAFKRTLLKINQNSERHHS
ncbi:MarR family transcriptional regulator for hemolysin [Paenibacillus castaneae]|uniref:MarR family winged helix-turn-helix transcriptional regulator n=1 Tax=Paenibacillus castaneae TaxID=474957 RepID=UPI000C9AEA70|nr:MarR family transcriptional regulator [Paenibacillus castaneae]NIK76219.1 MarR family transcriptional regulator for hemolysin [Paenibacillus castaneae]